MEFTARNAFLHLNITKSYLSLPRIMENHHFKIIRTIFHKAGAKKTVIIPEMAIASPLIAPSVSPISMVLAVPMA